MKNELITTIFNPLLLTLFINLNLLAGSPPELSLAQVYKQDVDVSLYLVSEKLDGVRAFWNGKELISRQGLMFSVPAWFTSGFPEQELDGELWMGRNSFERLLSTVRKKIPVESEWRKVKYMVFELPQGEGTFLERYSKLQRIFSDSKNPYVQAVEQFKVQDSNELNRIMAGVVSLGGEGLMLHRADSEYKIGRTADLLKVKPYFDAEAQVVAHHPGKGKYKGKMGSIGVAMSDGTTFRIGTGFTDSERGNPPAIGSIVTFKYHGKTRNGIPKFASFLRIRYPPAGEHQ